MGWPRGYRRLLFEPTLAKLERVRPGRVSLYALLRDRSPKAEESSTEEELGLSYLEAAGPDFVQGHVGGVFAQL